MPNCTHEFHKNCIDHWMYHDSKFCCPVCRTFQGKETVEEIVEDRN